MVGKNFFILTDSTFSPQEIAKIRFEIRAANGDINTVGRYGGVDIAVYEVSQPVNFLKSQKNLHHVSTKYDYKPSGEVANALSFVWDHFYKKSRMLWQKFLSVEAREKAVVANDAFKQPPPDTYKTDFKHYKQFRPMKGFKLVDEFRYPLTYAKPIAPPDIKLAGSSHTFNEVNIGNVHIPLGKLKPGLYLVEAILGDHRANTLVFVSDSILVSKISGNELFLWAADKFKGTAIHGMKILVTDGIGTLHEGETNGDGVETFKGKGPEQSYFIGTDKNGGVVISENFYHDSEIYSQKIYAFTDRPLYQPGDVVKMKVVARRFIDSSKSEWLKSAQFELIVVDPSGTILLKEELKLEGEAGGETSFRLPSFTLPGGYTVLLRNKNDTFASEFRVARYTKPHFNLDVMVSPSRPKLNTPLKATVQLSYANGKPLTTGDVNVIVRRQKLTVLEGETDMQSLFPVQVSDTNLKVDAEGKATLDLPAVKEPSKYILYVKATDESSLTVNATSELIVESSNDSYMVEAPESFSSKGQEVQFSLRKVSSTSDKDPGLVWNAIRLEDQSTLKGEVKNRKFSIKFPESGTYQVKVFSESGDLLGGRSHIVSGEKLKTIAGFINLTTDKESYLPGDKARILVNFSEDVGNALITVERDKVEKFSISGSGSWAKVTKQSPRQWVVEIPVDSSMSPNVTFSVLYVKDGKLIFNNKGLQIKRPEIELSFKLDKKNYAPGDTVKLDLVASLDNKPVLTNISLGVVDEMIYVLQPEISPSILDFFYHRRRNQVKTSSSLSFFTYDSSVSASGKSSPSSSYEDRPLKLKDRPRREDIDTAFWSASLKTDATGKLSVQFKLPDSVTRWRVTARAIAGSGVVGQNLTHFNADKDIYLKWGGLTELRKNDQIETSIVGFNLTGATISGKLITTANKKEEAQDVILTSGANYLPVRFKADATQDINLKFEASKKAKDRLSKLITVKPVNWETTKELNIDLVNGANTITVPKNSFSYQIVSQMSLSDKFLKTAKDLIEYPYGCVEQTASRLIPLTFSYAILKNSPSANPRVLKDKIISSRESLIRMANQDGLFGWYDDMGNEGFLTVYAYLADFYAARELGIKLPANHFSKMQKAYRDLAVENPLRSSIMVWMISQTGQPIQTLVSGVWTRLKNDKTSKTMEARDSNNLVMNSYISSQQHNLSVLLLAIANEEAKANKLSVNKVISAEIEKEARAIAEKESASSSALLRAASLRLRLSSMAKEKVTEEAETIFYTVAPSYSTADRSLSLILLQDVIKNENRQEDFKIQGQWKKIASPMGLNVWEYNGAPGEKILIELQNLKSAAGNFKLIYGTFEADKHDLPLTLTHNYYELAKDKDGNYQAHPIKGNEFAIDKFYVSEVKIEGSGSYDYGLLEVPLVPGSVIETGFDDLSMTIARGKGQEKITLGRKPEMTGLSYGIPVRSMTAKSSYYHVVRFGAKGTFNLPQARFFEMYRSYRKAYALKNSPVTQVVNVK